LIRLVVIGTLSGLPAWANPQELAEPPAPGYAAFRAGRFADAAREFQQVVARNPADSAAHAGLVRALLKQDRLADAERAAARACTGAPADAQLLVACGDVSYRQGAFAAADRWYSTAVAVDPTCARGWWSLARLDLIERRNRSARLHLQRAYDLDPTDPNIALDWAFARPTRTERAAAAERHLALAVNEPPSSLADIQARIEVLKALGDADTFVVSEPRRAYRIDLREATAPDGRVLFYSLSALVNGEKVRLRLDTGLSGVLLTRKAAERSRAARLATGVPVRGVGNDAGRTGFIAIADTLKVAGLELRRCELRVDDGHAFDGTDGLIGTDVFSRFLVRLSFSDAVMELRPPDEGGPSIAEDFWEVERTVTPGFTPVHVLGHLLVADARLAGARDLLLIVDSGATAPVLSLAAARRVTTVHATNADVRGAAGRVRNPRVTGPVTLRVAGLEHPGSFVAVDLDEQNRRAGTEIGGVLGLDALRHFTLTIDYTNGLVRFDRVRAR
jgi:Flp pilus assembly protein TadD/predicted aspartyl protease